MLATVETVTPGTETIAAVEVVRELSDVTLSDGIYRTDGVLKTRAEEEVKINPRTPRQACTVKSTKESEEGNARVNNMPGGLAMTPA